MQGEIAEEVDESSQTAQDYSIMVEDPGDADTVCQILALSGSVLDKYLETTLGYQTLLANSGGGQRTLSLP